ncbi:hypothetical protein V8C42DRAFT_334548 [Trichoderma barbatum]
MQPASLPINMLNVSQLAEIREGKRQTSVASPPVLAPHRISSIYPLHHAQQKSLLSILTNGANKEAPFSPGYPSKHTHILGVLLSQISPFQSIGRKGDKTESEKKIQKAKSKLKYIN